MTWKGIGLSPVITMAYSSSRRLFDAYRFLSISPTERRRTTPCIDVGSSTMAFFSCTNRS